MYVPWRGKTIRNMFNIRIQTASRILLALVVSFSISGAAFADQFDGPIAALRAQANAQQATAAQFSAQANDYQSRVNQLNAQIAELQAQINLNQAQYDQVTAQIATNEANLAEKKAVLGANLKSMYVDSTVTPLEMIASSNNLSDYFNQQQYQDSIKDKIQLAMADILSTQKQLAIQKTQVEALLAQQNNQKRDLASARAEANQLLATAAQNASAANAQVAASNSQISVLKAQQYAAIAAASFHVSGGSGCGGYPGVWCNAAQDSLADDWGMYNRECVSYAAWAASARGHHVPYWGGRGDAKQWPNNADAAGIPRSSIPQVDDVGIYMGGQYGHAMIVEKVLNGGRTVRVSSFNGDGTGHFSVDDWPTASLTFIHFR